MLERHEGLIDPAEANALRDARICVAGAGGAGGWTCLALARLGIRHFVVADPETFEPSNGNRQAGCCPETIGRNKAEVLAEEIQRIAPDSEVDCVPEGVTPENAVTLVRGTQAVIDGVDLYQLRPKRDMYHASRSAGIPVFTSPVLGFGAALAIFDPVKSPSFEKYFGKIPETANPQDPGFQRYVWKIGIGMFGFRPALDLKAFMKQVQEGNVPSAGTACMVSGAWVATAILDYLGNNTNFPHVPTTLHLDLRSGRLIRVGPFRRRLFAMQLLLFRQMNRVKTE